MSKAKTSAEGATPPPAAVTAGASPVELGPLLHGAAAPSAPALGAGAESQISNLKSQNSLIGKSESEIAALNEIAEILIGVLTAKNARPVGYGAAIPRGKGAKAEAARRLGWSLAKLKRMLTRFQRQGMAGLARKMRADRGRSRVADARVIARIKTSFLQTYRPSAASIYKDVARDYEMSGLPAPSYTFVLRQTKRIDPDMIARFRLGEREFDDKFALVTPRKKPALPRLWVDGDHHLMDHIVVFADGSIGRPWLTAVQDIGTNEILGYTIARSKRSTYPGKQTIADTLRRAILKKSDPAWPSFGLFEVFYSDLGKDFRSQYVRTVCHDLNIKVVYTRGYHGKSKPIERWFGVKEGELKKLPGYIGRSTDTNPLKQVIGAPRDWESMRKDIMTVDQFAAELYSWIVNKFHHAESRALKGYSPIGLLEKHIKDGWTAREVTNERALDLLMMSRAGNTVQRMGVQMFSTAYQKRFFLAPELAGLVSQDVQVFWDPANIGEIIIYKDDRFVCKAQNRELLDFGASEADLAREREIKKAQRDSVRARHQELLTQAQYPNEMERVQAEKRLEKVEIAEREKIAVGAAAPAASVLLPKFAAAARTLREVKQAFTTKDTKVTKVREREELKSSEDLFAAEDYDRGEDLKSSEELFEGEDD